MTADLDGEVCSARNCFVGDGTTGCRDGHEPAISCPHLQLPDEQPSPVLDGSALPWSGLQLGWHDLEAVAGAGRSRVVAVVGLPYAGKTSALAAFWTRLRQGHHPAGRRFAGSFTMFGWQAICAGMAWPPAGTREFPPHTTAASHRVPALLHVAVTDTGSPFDLLFTDVPGEWFRDWSVDAGVLEGTTWIAEHADVFMLFSDSAALGGETRGSARSEYLKLASRVKDAASGRPVIPVRAKADRPITPRMEETLSASERQWFDRSAMPLSVYASDSFPDARLEAFDAVVDAVTRQPRSSQPATPPMTGDPFIDFRSSTPRRAVR